MKYKWFYFLISAVIIVPGIVSLVTSGLKLGIDFTGGSRWEIQSESELPVGNLRKSFDESQVSVSSIVLSGQRRYLIKTKFITEEKKNEISGKIEKEFGKISQLRFETIGPLLGVELLTKTLVALILSILIVLSYITWQFRNVAFGLAATVATLHDALVLLGSFALLSKVFNFEADILFVTALLTVLSFSVHDTIVTYDRIREGARKFPNASFDALINKAMSETLVRSLNNSLTVIFMLVALVVLGGETIRQFAVALLIGTITGTYSSLFTAAPLLSILVNHAERGAAAPKNKNL